MHLMIDLETLSTEQNAIILNIGAIGFDPFSSNVYTQHSFYARIDLESQPTRHESEQTLKWWMKQHKDSQDARDCGKPLDYAQRARMKVIRARTSKAQARKAKKTKKINPTSKLIRKMNLATKPKKKKR